MEISKKIALFTCHEDPNYGSMLQAYALAEAIKSLGKTPEYITYHSYPRQTWFLRMAKMFIKRLGLWRRSHEFSFFETPSFATTMAAFKKFHDKYIPCSEEEFYSNTIQNITNDDIYENYIVGSDQSWSPYLYDVKKPYFLDFSDLSKRNAYAPSLGTTTITDEYKQLLKQKLVMFDHLSCREKINSDMLSSLIGKEVVNVLDPTLLLMPKEWDKLCTHSLVKKEYILAYILGEKDSIVNFAENLGKEKHLPVYYIATRPCHLNHTKTLTGIGPDDFVGLIKNASYVVTDSYHGCLFSINYNVQFYAFSKHEGNIDDHDNARILEFLSFLHIEQRFQGDTQPAILKDVEYEVANSIINTMRKKSFAYLKRCIE